MGHTTTTDWIDENVDDELRLRGVCHGCKFLKYKKHENVAGMIGVIQISFDYAKTMEAEVMQSERGDAMQSASR